MTMYTMWCMVELTCLVYCTSQCIQSCPLQEDAGCHPQNTHNLCNVIDVCTTEHTAHVSTSGSTWLVSAQCARWGTHTYLSCCSCGAVHARILVYLNYIDDSKFTRVLNIR